MKKLLFSLLFSLFPILAQATTGGSLSFAPPLTDVSVVFLGNIFGIVDGVLHGTGSQIMGNIFAVFNAAVLALGGIVIMYTLIVSTVNTAHEGQMLGQKWSSLWVPVRATLGLGLLIPKASGYCLMQIFVMWVVVQGVGAADKVWDAALNYLNRGGVIVQQQINPITSIMGGGYSVTSGAATMLYGQICMLGLETALTTQRQGYMNSKGKGAGPCAETSSGTLPSTTSSVMASFCNTPVQDFIGSVNAVIYQTNNPLQSTFKLPMPNFDSSSPYAALNGICGTISWNALDTTTLGNITSLNKGNLETAKLSRAIAVQQMYSLLSSLAGIIVLNDPQLTGFSTSGNTSSASNPPFAPFAQEQFGVPFSSSGSICPANEKLGDSSSTCVSWGADASGNSAPIFSGSEFQNAVGAYNAVMLPTLNLLSQASSSTNANEQRAFISSASSQGWMLAGSYFFSLASINSANTTTATVGTPTDTNSGLGSSTFAIQTPQNAFDSNKCQGDYAALCTWFNGDVTKVNQVKSMIDGSPNATVTAPPIPTSSQASSTVTLSPITGPGSSTGYGLVNNELMVVLPGQAGTAPPKFVMNLIPDMGKPNISLPTLNFACGSVTVIWPFKFCLIQWVAEAMYNYIFVPIFNFFLGLVTGVINTVVMAFMALPLLGMAQIFQYGVGYITQPNVNPIIALANMGVNYINFAADLWIYLLGITIMTMFLGPFGIVIMAILAMSMPLLLAWLGTMVAIGFTTAYFIPFLPYMIFTFGSIAWLMAVIEAMVAAPIVALGITHPEGEGPFGKGEQAIMILMNVFLRPALMIIGYIAGIILSYVGVWVINAGFANVLPFIQGPSSEGGLFSGFNIGMNFSGPTQTQVQTTTGYTGWAGVYGFFFSILIYTTMYLTVVQKAFTLITTLPDKVLRWIGGQPESVGQEASQWGDEGKKQVEGAGTQTEKAQQQTGKQLTGYGTDAISSLKGSGPQASAESGPKSTPSAIE
ncbi:MAG: type IVB secretion system protein DotA [Legionella sp.]|nr:type IVB secretion system protein DotA [Legionella sp.]